MDSLTDGDAMALAGLSPAAMLLLGRLGQVHYANPAAEALLAGIVMVSAITGNLVARRKAEDREIRDALSGLTVDYPAAVVCLRTRETLPLLVMDFRLLASSRIACRITDVAARPIPPPDRLKTLFGLTKAEARVAAAMVSGLGIQGVAKACGVEPETVRTQAKRIRVKLGARTQNQLLGILWATGTELGGLPASSLPSALRSASTR